MKLWVSIFLIIIGTLTAQAQLNFGEFNTPYAGVHSLSFNPAEIVDSRYKFHVNLVGLGGTVSNNFVGLSKDLVSLSPPTITDANRPQYFIRSLNGKPKHAYIQGDIMGPTALMSFGRNNKFSLGISTGVKTLVTANNLSEKLAMFIYNNKDPESWGTSESKDLMVNMSMWTYTGLTVGAVIIDNRKITLKGAITGKLNQGLASTYFKSDRLFLNLTDENKLIDANGTVQAQFASPFVTNNQFKGDSLGFGKGGSGFGIDAGFIFEKKDRKDYSYEFDCRTDNYRKDKNKYAWRFGISVSDFGSMSWKPSGPKIRSFTLDSNSFVFPLNVKTFNRALEPGALVDSLRKYRFNGIDMDSTYEEYSMSTPATLNAFFDVHIYKGLYVAVNGMYGFVSNNSAASWTQNTRFTLTPRLEGKRFGVYLPISHNMLAEETSVGVGFRLFCMNLALSDLMYLAKLKSQTKTYGFNLSFNIPILNRAKPKDKDGDLMGRKTDKCKDGAGDCNTGGCPEPDDDGDGVKNSMDKCPKQKGPATQDGCPDTDEDGVPDSKDRCPKLKGPYELGGCPDKDGDGIIDSEDKCPKEKGSLILEGCPDSDGDGVADYVDECPTQKGVHDSKGCPKVEIVDTDKDGIPDTDDKCPKQYGSKANQGCPIIEKEAFDIAKIAQEKLEFHTGSSEIKPESLPSLTVLSDYLSKNPTITLTLSGHTDNVGKPEKNMKLSESRAQSVKDYFVTHGVDATRISAAGYGDTKPIGDNRTASGRAVNRRVEIVLK